MLYQMTKKGAEKEKRTDSLQICIPEETSRNALGDSVMPPQGNLCPSQHVSPDPE